MAVFDLGLERVCVRVVYDGVASAGKTTNLRQLAELFAAQRRGELVSPADLEGRTLYFDWLEIAAGVVRGFPLVCQVLSVPGQVALTPRRRRLLETADVVVHVCESDARSVARLHEGLALLEELDLARGAPVPLVVQANKQDAADAAPVSVLAAALGRPRVPIVEAIASDGIGVMDTFVTAVRAAVRDLQARADAGDARLAVGPAESAASTFERLAGVALDHEALAEMILQQALSSMTLGESLTAPERPAATSRAPVAPRAAVPLPDEHVPTGFVWPAHTGRASLRALSLEPDAPREITLDSDGHARLGVGGVVLTTGVAARFEGVEPARQALVRAARERTQLGALLAPETVLVVKPADGGVSWLWTLAPEMPTVAQLLGGRSATDPETARLSASYARALCDALHVEAAHGLALDLSPHAFGVRQGTVRHVGGLTPGPAARDVGVALLGALRALASVLDDLEPVLVAIESGLTSRLPVEEREKLARRATWPSAPDARVPPMAARRLARALDPRSEAA